MVPGKEMWESYFLLKLVCFAFLSFAMGRFLDSPSDFCGWYLSCTGWKDKATSLGGRASSFTQSH